MHSVCALHTHSMLLSSPDLAQRSCFVWVTWQDKKVSPGTSTTKIALLEQIDPDIPRVAMEIKVGIVCEKCRNTRMSLW